MNITTKPGEAMNTFGERLRLLREQADKKMRDVAEALGCSVVYISDIERGRRNPPSADKIKKIAQVISTPATELLDLATKEKGRIELDLDGASPSLEEAGLVLARSWKDLSEEQAKKILAIIEKRGEH
ncbi:helix-turn-helix domain-containing protein [Desulfovibrio sp. JY]|nr:helix-turn-helix domain-containing protein [Desulfovibrio sp. JY]